MGEMGDSIGSRICRLLKEKGITRSDLADKLGVTTATLRRYIRDERVPDAIIISKIAKELNVTTDYLIKGKVKRERKDYYIILRHFINNNIDKLNDGCNCDIFT